MSESAPERGRGGAGGPFLKRKLGGVPVWAWGGLGLVAIGGIWYLIHKRNQANAANQAASSAKSGSGGCNDSNGNPVPCASILAVGGGGNQAIYEQLTSQLTGLSGQDAAILAAIKDSQGDHDHDHDTGDGGDQDHGGDRVKVPDVLGADTDQAENTIQSAGLNPQVSGPDAGTVVAGEIPPAGTMVRRGTTVVLATKKGRSRQPGTGGPPTRGPREPRPKRRRDTGKARAA